MAGFGLSGGDISAAYAAIVIRTVGILRTQQDVYTSVLSLALLFSKAFYYIERKSPGVGTRAFLNKYGSYLLSRMIVQYHRP